MKNIEYDDDIQEYYAMMNGGREDYEHIDPFSPFRFNLPIEIQYIKEERQEDGDEKK